MAIITIEKDSSSVIDQNKILIILLILLISIFLAHVNGAQLWNNRIILYIICSVNSSLIN